MRKLERFKDQKVSRTTTNTTSYNNDNDNDDNNNNNTNTYSRPTRKSRKASTPRSR